MPKKEVDVASAVKLILELFELATCIKCCKYYVAPETAACGHTLCHHCWKGQRTCHQCGVTVSKKSTALNMVIRTITDNISILVKQFEDFSGIKMDSFEVDELNRNYEGIVAKNVKEWLSSSQNHFSVPPTCSETQKSLPDNVIELSSSKIQIHCEPNKVLSPPRVAHVGPPQDDWDVIEPAPDTEDIVGEKDKRNIVGPMDLEAFYLDYDTEFTTNNPRRSSRKRDSVKSLSKKGEKNDSNAADSDKKLEKAKQNWTNVKKMKKEFGKLTKNNKSKLNVSIEMCKRTNTTNSDKKSNLVTVDKLKDTSNLRSAETYVIEDDTPEIKVTDKNKVLNKKEKVVEKNICTTTTKVVDDDRAVKNTETSKKDNSIDKSDQSSDFKMKSLENEVINVTNKNDETNDGKEIPIQSNAKESANKEEDNDLPNVPFLKKSNFQTYKDDPNTIIVKNNEGTENLNSDNTLNDDIYISIRIGTVVTNITINKKRDVTFKVNSDREVQTVLGSHVQVADNVVSNKLHTESNNMKECEKVNTQYNKIKEREKPSTRNKEIENPCTQTQSNKLKESEKSQSTKKNTASAETVTAQYEISESVEKELSNVMECDENAEIPQPVSNISKPAVINKPEILTEKAKTNLLVQGTEDKNLIETELGFLDEVDIFNSGSVKELNVKSLKHVKGTPSEILVPTNKTRVKTQREKRRRDHDAGQSQAKKRKPETQNVIENSEIIPETDPDKLIDMNSEAITYDAVMSQVFANIDADIRDTQSSKNVISLTKDCTLKKKQLTQTINKNADSKVRVKQSNKNVDDIQKYSENMFSTMGQIETEHHFAGPETQSNIDNLLTPGMCNDLGDKIEKRLDDIVMATPNQNDDSDHSVVEETPQKDKTKASSKGDSGNKTATSNKKLQLNPKTTTSSKEPTKDPDEIINITDSVLFDKDDEPEIDKTRIDLETPSTINKFQDNIQHKSTPVARKSLDFARNKTNDEDDDDITLCPSANIIGNTTQEKAIMSEAFNNTLVRRPLSAQAPVTKFCVAGSCLSNDEIANVKILCYKRKWLFVDKYVPQLTHLVVRVDDENKTKRSVKYMCALAAGKWIVSYKWVEMCLKAENKIVNEEPFEALDTTGDAGPRNSRLATQKIFKGIKFYCMPPFSVLDVDTLKAMLEAAGGTVVHSLPAVRAQPDCPSLVLAEPANTEEDRFMYLTMESGVVPINYEWVLNCLGSYTLCSVYELLLCPTSLLPAATKHWPLELMASEYSNVESI